MSKRNGRKIPFSFAGLTLEASDYSITCQDKVSQVPLLNGIVRTITVGKAASQIVIHGKLPVSEAPAFFSALEWEVSAANRTLTLDGASYSYVTLDRFHIEPDSSSGFAAFVMEFHF